MRCWKWATGSSEFAEVLLKAVKAVCVWHEGSFSSHFHVSSAFRAHIFNDHIYLNTMRKAIQLLIVIGHDDKHCVCVRVLMTFLLCVLLIHILSITIESVTFHLTVCAHLLPCGQNQQRSRIILLRPGLEPSSRRSVWRRQTTSAVLREGNGPH